MVSQMTLAFELLVFMHWEGSIFSYLNTLWDLTRWSVITPSLLSRSPMNGRLEFWRFDKFHSIQCISWQVGKIFFHIPPPHFKIGKINVWKTNLVTAWIKRKEKRTLFMQQYLWVSISLSLSVSIIHCSLSSLSLSLSLRLLILDWTSLRLRICFNLFQIAWSFLL